jgi:hypothetical protein
LAAGIGARGALRFYRAMLSATAWPIARDRHWHTLLAITPAGARADWARLAPPGTPRMAQVSGDLGRRMEKALAPFPRAILIGSDIPGLGRLISLPGFAHSGGQMRFLARPLMAAIGWWALAPGARIALSRRCAGQAPMRWPIPSRISAATAWRCCHPSAMWTVPRIWQRCWITMLNPAKIQFLLRTILHAERHQIAISYPLTIRRRR